MSDYGTMSLEELEFSLPMTVQRREKKRMPCADCGRECEETVTYRQVIWRSDDYGREGLREHKRRTYEISFRQEYGMQNVLFRTERYRSFREALIEAHKKLDEMGIQL